MKITTKGIPYPIPDQLLSKLTRSVELFYNQLPLKKLWWNETTPPNPNHWDYGWQTTETPPREWTNGVRLGPDGKFYITYASNDEFVEGLAVAHVAIRQAIEELVKVGLTELTILFNE